MKAKILILAILVLGFGRSYGQQAQSFQTWFDYMHQNKLNGNWVFFSDYGLRFSNVSTNGFVRLHARPSVQFRKSLKHTFRGGIGLFYTNYINSIVSFEIRPWQGYKLRWPNIRRLRACRITFDWNKGM